MFTKISHTDDFRYERKFLISQMSPEEIEGIIHIHPALFSEIYHQRTVNNIYLDHPNMNCYLDAVNGNEERVKIRVRWYGDAFGQINHPVLEFKMKKGLVGTKKIYPLDNFLIDQDFQLNTIKEIITRSTIPEILKKDLCSLTFSFINRYQRKYFQSANRHYRITIDSKIEFYSLGRNFNPFLHSSIDTKNVVLEIKYHNTHDDFVKTIAQHLPFRMTKNSKYVNGIDTMYINN